MRQQLSAIDVSGCTYQNGAALIHDQILVAPARFLLVEACSQDHSGWRILPSNQPIPSAINIAVYGWLTIASRNVLSNDDAARLPATAARRPATVASSANWDALSRA